MIIHPAVGFIPAVVKTGIPLFGCFNSLVKGVETTVVREQPVAGLSLVVKLGNKTVSIGITSGQININGISSSAISTITSVNYYAIYMHSLTEVKGDGINGLGSLGNHGAHALQAVKGSKEFQLQIVVQNIIAVFNYAIRIKYLLGIKFVFRMLRNY